MSFEEANEKITDMELKSRECPFCGFPARVGAQFEDEECNHVQVYYVVCNQCRVTMLDEEPNKLVDRWNYRELES